MQSTYLGFEQNFSGTKKCAVEFCLENLALPGQSPTEAQKAIASQPT